LNFLTGKTHALCAAAFLLTSCTSSTAPEPVSAQAAPPRVDATVSAEAAKRIEAIERGLLPSVVVAGEAPNWTIEERMREHRIPALSIAVFDNYELQWAKAYGMADGDAGSRATDETLFLAGSISKSVNALGVMLAAADGKLALDQPVNELLQSWKLPENALTRATPVTLRKLLSHTAGTTVHGFPGYAEGVALPSVQQILNGEPPANTAAVRVDLAPGTRFRYSGGGTTITQLALTDRTGQAYPEVLAKLVLEPLGMRHSSFEQTLSPERLSQAAVGYDGDGKAIEGKRHRYPEMAAAGLWTTPSDLARFFIEIARARAGQSSPAMQEIAIQMTSQVINTSEADDGAGIGLGVFLFRRHGAEFFGHAGADEGFQANAVVSMDGGRGIVIMANSNNGFRIFSEIERAVFAEYGWPGAEPVHARVALDAAVLESLPGQYRFGAIDTAVTVQDGKILAQLPFEPAAELVPIAADRLIHRENGSELRVTAPGSFEVTRAGTPTSTVTRAADAERHPLFKLEAGRFDEAAAAWRERIQAAPDAAADEASQANSLGYRLLARDPTKAIEVMRLIATVFPDSANAHDSLGEAYMRLGDTVNAIASYERALALFDTDTQIPEAEKSQWRDHAATQLEKLREVL
jgi:CubicO group peptidase (beta-lactamase class C family)